jgi:hypothetical protein
MGRSCPGRPCRPGPGHPPSGVILAVVTVTGCHEADGCCRPWGVSGGWHWTLADVKALAEPVPATGQPGLWKPPDEITAAVLAQLPAAR